MDIMKFGHRSLITWNFADLRQERIKEKQMSREIKFRAWDKESKIMHSWEDLFQLMDLVDIFQDEDLILMQYTGLKDKNGKDLDWWEGDIFDDAGVLKVIVNEKGCFWFENIESKRRIPCYDIADSYGEWADDIKKKGNIHQNPELMEQGNGK